MDASDEPQTVELLALDARLIAWGQRLLWRFRATDDGALLTLWTRPNVTPRTNAGKLVGALTGAAVVPGDKIDGATLVGRRARIVVELNDAGYGRIGAIGDAGDGPMVPLDYKRRRAGVEIETREADRG